MRKDSSGTGFVATAVVALDELVTPSAQKQQRLASGDRQAL